MSRRTGQAVACVIVGLGLLDGCRRPAQSTTVPAPASTPSPVTATMPVATPLAALWIDGVSYRFPAATLVLTSQGEGMSAMLCSDDPPAAIHSGYHGNSFMIQMKLDITSADDLDGYIWKYTADASADVDSNTGVFLDGTSRQLQPTTLSISFHKKGDDLIADLDGNFQSLDSKNPAAHRQPAEVNGRLYIGIKAQ